MKYANRTKDGRTTLHGCLSENLANTVKALAKERGVTVSAMIEYLIMKGLENPQPESNVLCGVLDMYDVFEFKHLEIVWCVIDGTALECVVVNYFQNEFHRQSVAYEVITSKSQSASVKPTHIFRTRAEAESYAQKLKGLEK